MNFHKDKVRTIRWQDHVSDSRWMSIKEIATWVSKPTICTSKGIVTYEDSKLIVLSASFDGEDSYGENICIMKKCIVK